MLEETLHCIGNLVMLAEALTAARVVLLDGLEAMEWEWINPVTDANLLLRVQTDEDNSCFFTADALLTLQQTPEALLLVDEYGERRSLVVA